MRTHSELQHEVRLQHTLSNLNFEILLFLTDIIRVDQ